VAYQAFSSASWILILAAIVRAIRVTSNAPSPGLRRLSGWVADSSLSSSKAFIII